MRVQDLFDTAHERAVPLLPAYQNMPAYIIEDGVQKFRYADCLTAMEYKREDIRFAHNLQKTNIVLEAEVYKHTLLLHYENSQIKIGSISEETGIKAVNLKANSIGSMLMWLFFIISAPSGSMIHTYLNAFQNDKSTQDYIYRLGYAVKKTVLNSEIEVLNIESEDLCVPDIDTEAAGMRYFSSKTAEMWLPLETMITQENINLIPDMTSIVMPGFLNNILQKIKYCNDRNFAIFGESGTGKSTAAKILASILKVPYRFLSCAEGIKATDLLVKVIPRGDRNISSVNVPTFADLWENPEFAMIEMCGKYPKEAQEIRDKDIDEEVKTESLRELAFQIVINGTNKNGEFQIIDSELIKSIEEGGICELQEVTLIKSPGILPVLNSILDDNKEVVTMDGRRIKRHPNSIIILTGNINYAGCRELNEAIKSRMDDIIMLDHLDADKMHNRVIARFPSLSADSDILLKMANTCIKVKEYCKKNRIRGFVCGYREYESWAKILLIPRPNDKTREEHVLGAVYNTVLSKCTFDEEIQKEILQNAVGLVFKVSHML